MKVKLTTLMLAAAALLASCSQDDGLQQTTVNTDGLTPVTLSVTLPDEGMKTRAVSATEDETATRAYLEILVQDDQSVWRKATGDLAGVHQMVENGSTFTLSGIYLDPAEDYRFLFWADNAPKTADAPADLENVSYEDGSIAFADVMAWDKKNTVSATLQHVVAKVTLKTTTDIDKGNDLYVKIPATYTAYNVSTGNTVGTATTDKKFEIKAPAVTGTKDGAEIFSFYTLVDEGTQELTVYHNGYDLQVANVPLAPNKHTVLVGDVRNIGWEDVTFTAGFDGAWGDTATEKFPKIDLTAGAQTITDDGEYWIVGQTATNTLTINGNATVHIENTSIKVSTGNAITVTDGNPTIYVEGTNTVESSNGAGIYVAQGCTVTVTSTSRNNVLTARGGYGGSGIGAGSDTSCGNIEISNVTIYAYGNSGKGDAYSAGIGGSGNNACGTITIDNATIFAYGTNDGAAGNMSTPGIGGGTDGGSNGAYGIITIKNNSTVSVQRGAAVSDYIGSAGHTNGPANSPNGIDATIDDTSTVTKLN